MVRISKIQRKNGYFYLRYWNAGRPLDESTRTKNEAEAEAIRVRRELEMNAGFQPLQHADVGDLIARYIASLPFSSSSHVHEANRILHGFLHVCGRKRADGPPRLQTQQLTPELIDRFILRRKQTSLHDGERRDRRGRRIVRRKAISNVSLRKELRYLSSFMNWCCRQRPAFLRENPIALSNARRIKDDAQPHFMITEEEFRALLKQCDTLSEYLFLVLAWWTGGRRNEILALHYYDFDFANKTVRIVHKKNNKTGVLPVSQQIVDLVQQSYRQASEADKVFSCDPFPYRAFSRLCRSAGVRPHRVHDFRISVSMKLKVGGFDASLAALWVGNTATTNRAHYSDLTGVAQQIALHLELSGLPPVPQQTS